MKYESKRTEKGNVGVSWDSQAAADMQAAEMDKNNNINCYNCSGCSGCSGCSDCSGCSGCSDCSDCSYCSGCSGCSYCSYCSGCSDCLGILRWGGDKVSNLIGLNGLHWPVSISNTHIQIGCQNHSIERWNGFTDNQIEAMDDHALEFWKTNKSLIMAIAKRVNS